MTFNDIITNLEKLDCQQLAKLNAESARVWNKKNKHASFTFKKGDEVRFADENGTVKFGTVIRCGQKTMKIEVESAEGRTAHWRVNPHRLKHVNKLFEKKEKK